MSRAEQRLHALEAVLGTVGRTVFAVAATADDPTIESQLAAKGYNATTDKRLVIITGVRRAA